MQFRVAMHVHMFWNYLSLPHMSIGHRQAQLCVLSRSGEANR